MKDQIKFIAYAYPTSTFAKELGATNTGGWFVAQSHRREDGSMCPPYAAQGNDLFTDKSDPDLFQLLKEHDGAFRQSSCQSKYSDVLRTGIAAVGIDLATGGLK